VILRLPEAEYGEALRISEHLGVSKALPDRPAAGACRQRISQSLPSRQTYRFGPLSAGENLGMSYSGAR
jgi:hypothetical protein